VRMLAGRTVAEMAATDAYPPSPTIPTPRANLAVIEKFGAPQYRPLTHVFVARSREAAHFCRAYPPQYRPLTQGIPTARAKNTDPWRKGIPTPGAREYRLPAQKRQRIPTSRARNTDPSHKSCLEKACKCPDFDYFFRFPCCICSCLMSCCRKNGRMWDGEA
jgi:hypothetical protein